MVLALAPSHAISYTLSPRATFLFERARNDAGARPTPGVRVSWPRDLDVARPIPLEVEVTADPKSFLARARLFARRRGDRLYSVYDVDLPSAGSYRRVVLPPLAPGARRPETLDLFLAAYDRRGNEVLLWADSRRPAEIPLRYHPPTPWYRRWWVWTLAGTALAAGTGIAVYAILWEPSDALDADVSTR
jgi:hypothetical protein